MQLTDKQKKLLRLMYITYGGTIPYHFKGMGKLEDIVYPDNMKDSIWPDGWWVTVFGRAYESNEFLTYTHNIWMFPVTVTDKFVELIMKD